MTVLSNNNQSDGESDERKLNISNLINRNIRLVIIVVFIGDFRESENPVTF